MIITFCGRKGGTGKSTSADAIGSGLVRAGKRVLFIDLDTQGTLSDNFGADPDGGTLLEIAEGAKPKEVIQDSGRGDIVAADNRLDELAPMGAAAISKAIKKAAKGYDFTILDTPPALGVLTAAALNTADGIIVCARADLAGLKGYTLTQETLTAIGAADRVLGLLVNGYQPRRVIARELYETARQLAERNGAKLLSPVRECVAIPEAALHQESLFDYAPKCNAAADFEKILQELDLV